ncbi:MAG: chromosome partitioning protein [Glaciihabitans sp.]|nr:chromosome partitioning protein [Glaciihabitans sp.]
MLLQVVNRPLNASGRQKLPVQWKHPAESWLGGTGATSVTAKKTEGGELAGLETPKLGPTGRPLRPFPIPERLKNHGPARIIALCNQKGGVGKTTTTISLGATLAGYGRRVLAIDFDPQGALSAGLGINTHELTTIYDLLLGTSKDTAAAIVQTNVRGLDLIPANIDLSAAEVHLVNEVAREQILARVLRQVVNDYDVILIDCQPSLGLLTINALTAAHGVLIPLECEFFALRGVALLVETVDKVRDRLNPAIMLDGILPTMYDSRTLHSREVLERVVDAFGDSVLETVIGRTVKFPDASISGIPITTYAPDHPASLAYRQLARELISRGAVA